MEQVISNATASEAAKLREELQIKLENPLPKLSPESSSEISALQEQIKSTILNQKYSNEHFQKPDENVLKLGSKDRASLKSNVNSAIDFGNMPVALNIIDSNYFTEREKIKEGINDVRDELSDSSDIWHPVLSNAEAYREVLKFNSVQQDFRFTLGENVKIWKTLHIDFNRYALIGMTSDSTILVCNHYFNYFLVIVWFH